VLFEIEGVLGFILLALWIWAIVDGAATRLREIHLRSRSSMISWNEKHKPRKRSIESEDAYLQHILHT